MTIKEAFLLKEILEDAVKNGTQFDHHKIIRNSNLVLNMTKRRGDLAEAIVTYIECNMYDMAIICLSDFIKLEEKNHELLIQERNKKQP